MITIGEVSCSNLEMFHVSNSILLYYFSLVEISHVFIYYKYTLKYF